MAQLSREVVRHLSALQYPSNKRLTRVRNRAELAEGWYDPSTKQKADQEATEEARPPARQANPKETIESEDESDEDIGPALPSHIKSTRQAGPAVPNAEDLELRDGMFISNT